MDKDHKPEMSAQAAVELMMLFEEYQLGVIIDGGWAVDALLGEQTRPHDDLDIVILFDNVPKLREVLEQRGYTDVPRPDTRPVNFVMGDTLGHEVDIHTYTLDRVNHPEQGLDYPPESLYGMGEIHGYAVRCIDVVNLVQFHTGYEVDVNDYRDVKALCERFKLEIPKDYIKFVN